LNLLVVVERFQFEDCLRSPMHYSFRYTLRTLNRWRSILIIYQDVFSCSSLTQSICSCSVSMRLKAVTSIQKITKSMKMVSAAKYAKAERELRIARPYGAAALGRLHFNFYAFSVPPNSVRMNKPERLQPWLIRKCSIFKFKLSEN
jgi:ATP synthase